MPRGVAVGAPHHVTQPGNNRQYVFFVDEDRAVYLRLLKAHAERAPLKEPVLLQPARRRALLDGHELRRAQSRSGEDGAECVGLSLVKRGRPRHRS